MRGIAGAYEREAIRPHVLGRFADMLLAVEKHPAMLVYLDNQVSVGPNSKAGVNRGLGLNENLAREILELHTLGVGGGYSQEDVTNLARIITGWTVGNLANPLTEPGKFFFAPPRHEPGEWTVLGKRYPDQGMQTGENVLRALAVHPATARHIARKLARAFRSRGSAPCGRCASGENVPRHRRRSWRRRQGAGAGERGVGGESHQGAAALRLPGRPVARLCSEPKPADLLRLSAQLGQPLWRPPSPAGWPEADTTWAAPSALRERLRIAEVAARQSDRLADPRQVADDLFGDGAGRRHPPGRGARGDA